VNGKPFFLQGVNWVPPRVGYADTTVEEYERLISLYEDMGCNLLRVWGGAILEKEFFFDLCDQAGLLVWQEFPLSSSGVDNFPPDDPHAIDTLVGIASSYIERRAHHASLLLWCGGNELFEPSADVSGPGARPVTANPPCIAALKQLVAREDPERRFLSSSPSGLRLWGTPEEWGKGVHHDVHGPWGMPAEQTLEEWRAYWEADDALFRSEVGMPGAMDLDALKRYAGDGQVWPPEGEYWRHTAAWWTQRDRFKEQLAGLDDDVALAEYVRLTQELQANAYRIAAECCKQRFPRCGGFLIWMGHDCYPCPANNSVIDFERNPKPAYGALREVFRGDTE
jgi:beta-mannosidase